MKQMQWKYYLRNYNIYYIHAYIYIYILYIYIYIIYIYIYTHVYSICYNYAGNTSIAFVSFTIACGAATDKRRRNINTFGAIINKGVIINNDVIFFGGDARAIFYCIIQVYLHI